MKRIRHHISRLGEELKAFLCLAKKIGIYKSFICFFAKIIIFIMNKNGYKEYPFFTKILKKKHVYMRKYFDCVFSKGYQEICEKHNDYDNSFSNTIWVCWWQGLEKSPDVVKSCIHSIQFSAKENPVVIIDSKNVADYVDIPDWLNERVKEGKISRTNLSDFLRVSLLAKFGGLWLDSTFFCKPGFNFNECFCNTVWSIKRPEYLHCSVASGYFSGYSIHCSEEFRWFFAHVRELYLYYWKTHKILIDYLLIDYLIDFVIRHQTIAKKMFEQIPPNNDNCDELLKKINEPFNAEEWKKLSNNTGLFKLSWKMNLCNTINGKNTYYGKLVAPFLI